jgi:hypothetical protein
MANIQQIGRPPLHGKSYSREYQAWKAIKARCNNPKSKPYKGYGGRGIKLHEPWNQSFQSFFDYIGERPSKKHSIERINNNGNYEPGNVIWSIQKQQSNNRRSNKIISYKGESMTMSQWCDKLNLPYGRISKRISKYGWSVERAFNERPQIRTWK